MEELIVKLGRYIRRYERFFRPVQVRLGLFVVVAVFGFYGLFSSLRSIVPSQKPYSFLDFLEDGIRLIVTHWNIILAGLFAFCCFLILAATQERKKSFSDIDEDRKTRNQQNYDAYFQGIIAAIKQGAGDDKLRHSVAAMLKSETNEHPKTVPISGVDQYFCAITESLTQRAQDSDEKASLSLERGVSYIKVGFIFYFCVMFGWQTMFHIYGFKPEYVYGMAATTLLFIFIEFFSAWFLKQYRHFVDTATYLMKVKAIFDRYFLLYLIIKGSHDDLPDDAEKLEALTTTLTDEIKWPSDSHLKKADVAFAREALVSVADILRAVKTDRKDKKDRTSE